MGGFKSGYWGAASNINRVTLNLQTIIEWFGFKVLGAKNSKLSTKGAFFENFGRFSKHNVTPHENNNRLRLRKILLTTVTSTPAPNVQPWLNVYPTMKIDATLYQRCILENFGKFSKKMLQKMYS